MKILLFISLFVLNSCTHIFFQPSRLLYSRPEDLDLKYENRMIKSKDGTLLHSWFFPAQGESQGLAILFHGNAQNLSSHYLSLSWMTRFNFDVWVWDYRGYGLSQGEVSRKGVYEDTLSVLYYIDGKMAKRKNRDDSQKLILVGQSLGGNLLMKALVDSPYCQDADLLVLDSTFLSYKALAKEKMKEVWFLWPFQYLADFLISDEFSPKNSLTKINTPTLVIHAREDELIAFHHAEELYRKLNSSKKWFWAVEQGSHISTLGSGKGGYEKKLIELVQSL